MGAGMKFGDIDNTKVPNLALNKILCHNITLVVLFTFQFIKTTSGIHIHQIERFKLN